MAQPASTLQISISGPDPSQRIQKVLNEGEVLRIGRGSARRLGNPVGPGHFSRTRGFMLGGWFASRCDAAGRT